MWSILVPIEESEFLPSILKSAQLATERYGCYLEGFHLRFDLGGTVAYVGMGDAPVLLEDLQRDDLRERQRAREVFQDLAATLGRRPDGAPETQQPATVYFRTETPPGDTFVAQHARLFDITVLGQPDNAKAAPRSSTLEAVLFESGRPILIAPPMPPATLGERIVIAWNGSTETARTVAFARPLLEQAKSVVVLTVESGMVAGPSGEEAARSLQRVGIAAEARHVPQRHGTGPTVLEECRILGSDLLIKGAYTQSRLRQMIFGGATSHILQMAHLPVFMAH